MSWLNLDALIIFHDTLGILIPHVHEEALRCWRRLRAGGFQIPDCRQSPTNFESFGIDIERRILDVVRFCNSGLDD